jgi:repressor of nif and glnA expression
MLPVLFFGITAVASVVAYVMSEESEKEKENHYALASYKAELEKRQLENIRYHQRLLEESDRKKSELRAKLELLNNQRKEIAKNRILEKMDNISTLINNINNEINTCNDINTKNVLIKNRSELIMKKNTLYNELLNYKPLLLTHVTHKRSRTK